MAGELEKHLQLLLVVATCGKIVPVGAIGPGADVTQLVEQQALAVIQHADTAGGHNALFQLHGAVGLIQRPGRAGQNVLGCVGDGSAIGQSNTNQVAGGQIHFEPGSIGLHYAPVPVNFLGVGNFSEIPELDDLGGKIRPVAFFHPEHLRQDQGDAKILLFKNYHSMPPPFSLL